MTGVNRVVRATCCSQPGSRPPPGQIRDQSEAGGHRNSSLQNICNFSSVSSRPGFPGRKRCQQSLSCGYIQSIHDSYSIRRAASFCRAHRSLQRAADRTRYVQGDD